METATNTKDIKKEEIKYLETDPAQLERAKELARNMSTILDDKKARDIKILEVNKQTIIADYFVIATGTSSTHMRALAQELEFGIKEKLDQSPSRIDGPGNGDWVILDYDSVLAHIFNGESREYYKLEKLWGEASI
ncbi:MAG: ribosome silencing factor [Oscillospiraceae bacterium]|nr:ribosome silencing factor [Oscillospiraceae bacterium]